MSRTNFSYRDSGKNSFASSGLATNLPPAADMGRRGGDNADPNEGAKYRPPVRDTTWGLPTTTFARRKQEDPVDDIDDKWSKVFNKGGNSRPVGGGNREPVADLPINSRVAGFGAGFGESGERPQRSYADRVPREGGNRPQGEGRDFNDRPRGEGGFRERSDRPPREYGDRPQRDFGDRPPREFGGDRPSGDRPPREYNGRRNFGEGDARRPGFGEGDGRRQYNGEGRGGRRDNNREWESDPRFAGKFGRDLNPRFNDREKNFDGPLPTAPKASLDAGKVNAAPAAPFPIFKEKVVTPKQNKQNDNKKAEDEEAKAEKRKVEEEARQAKEEAEARAKETAANAVAASFQAVTEAIGSGFVGAELTKAAKTAVGGSLSAPGVLRAILSQCKDFGEKWYGPALYGDVLKASLKNNVTEEVQLLYEVQAYCASKNFGKIDIRGTQKRLIELLITQLLGGEIIDVDGIFAWADDHETNDYPGREEAIVQTTGMVAKLRETLLEEESEVDSDEDFDAPQAHLK